MNVNARIRSIVEDLVTKRGISQNYLAEQMGLSPTWLSRWLRTKDDRSLSLDAVERLKIFLRTHAADDLQTITQIDQAFTQSDDSRAHTRTRAAE